MPTKIDVMPGNSVSTLPWVEMLDGDPWVISEDEMSELGVKLESVRAYAHMEAANAGMKFRTRQKDGDLYLQAKKTK